MRRVVITGLGMINSLGLNKDESFKNIIDGQCGIRKIESFDASKHSVQIAGEISNFDPTEVMDKKDVKKADRFIQLGIKSAKEAMTDAKIDDTVERERFGISAASGIGGLINIQKNSEICLEKGPRRISPFFIPSALVNMLGGFISIEHKLQGPNLGSVTACAAGTHAISEAVKTIMIDGADRMLVIGAESTICAIGIGGFGSMKALSTRNDEPKKSSRPFDANRGGFVMGEGAASLVLEELEVAKARGAHIYAEIIGFGESGDAFHMTTPAPQGEGAQRAIKAALRQAKIDPSEVDYINAHGTSTKYNDWYETMAVKSIFGKKVPPMSSIKGQIGHCLGAAGAIEAVTCVMAMNQGVIPPTINYDDKDEDCDLDYVPNVARKSEIKIAMSNSFGFGGTNGVLIFKKYED